MKSNTEFMEIFANNVPLIMVELTDEGETIENIPWSDKKFDFSPCCIFVRKEGLVYYYYQKESVEWKINEAGKFDPQKMIEKAVEGYESVKETVEKEKTLNLEEFKEFIENLRKGWTWWDCMWWMVEYYDKNGLDTSKVLTARKTTEYLAPGTMAVIRKSVAKLLPKYGEYVDVLRISEVLEKNPPSEDILKKRLENYALAEGKLFESTEELEEHYKIQLPKEELIDEKEITGQTAYTVSFPFSLRKIKKSFLSLM